MKLIVIGSSSNAHLKIDSQFVSGYHAEILLLDNGEILLTDKGSKNGTYLNEQRLQPNKDIPIKRGDLVRFADKTLDWRNIPALPMPDLSKVKEMQGIGTNFRNKHQIQGDKVSRYHATLKRMSDKKWYIQDHSKNGTTVNGQSIPSNQDIKLKKGDKILCAGVPVPNPYGEGKPINYRRIFTVISLILLLSGGSYGIYQLLLNNSRDVDRRKEIPVGKLLSDEEIYAKYKNSTVLLYGCYYYKVSAGNLPLKDLGLPTEVIYSEETKKIQSIGEARTNVKKFTGTGFFISEDGRIATNLHIVRPWLFDKVGTMEVKSIISDFYKMQIAKAAADLPELNAFTSQINVEGVLAYIGMVPNGAYFSDENLKQCRELVGHDNIKKDVAILQIDTKRLPNENCAIVDLEQAVINDAGIKVGSHIYTLGYPFGLSLQDLESSKGVQILANGGSITQECNEYQFGFNAPSYGGASGSPIFNDRGQLIGVLSSGVTKSQGFNYAIKAAHIKGLLDESTNK